LNNIVKMTAIFLVPVFACFFLWTGLGKSQASPGDAPVLRARPGDTVAVTGLEPGGSVTREVAVTNQQDAPAFCTMRVRAQGENALDRVALSVTRGGVLLYDGTASDLAGLDMGALEPGEEHLLLISISLPGGDSPVSEILLDFHSPSTAPDPAGQALGESSLVEQVIEIFPEPPAYLPLLADLPKTG